MASLLEQLPAPSALDGEVTAFLGKVQGLSGLAGGFAPGDLEGAVAGVRNLSLPQGLDLIEGAVAGLEQIAARVPTDPAELTGAVGAGLGQLTGDLTRVGGLLKTLAGAADALQPVLSRFDAVQAVAGRFQAVTEGLPAGALDLDLAKVPDQLRYLSRLFGMFPEVASISPIRELKPQIDRLASWVTLDSAALTLQFQGEIQSLAEALPARLDRASQSGLDALAALETPLAAFHRSRWFDPCAALLAASEAVALDDPAGLDALIAALDAGLPGLEAAAGELGTAAEAARAALARFSPTQRVQDHINALLAITGAVGANRPELLAGLFGSIRNAINGFDLESIRRGSERIAAQLDEQLEKLGLGEFPQTVTELQARIVATLEQVDGAVLEVATRLSALTNDLRGLIQGLDLAALVEQVRQALTQVNTAVTALGEQVAAVQVQIQQFIQELEAQVQTLDPAVVQEGVRQLLAQIRGVFEDPAIQEILQQARAGVEEIAVQLEAASLTPVFDRAIAELDDLKAKLAEIDVSSMDELLREALKEALKIIRDVDFASQVTEALKEEFRSLLSGSTGLLQPIEEKRKEITALVEGFEPGKVVAGRLAAPFEAAVAELNRIQPSRLLTPLQEVREAAAAGLEPLRPAALLQPLSAAHAQLVAALRALSPAELLAPLNAELQSLTGFLDQLGLEALVGKVTDAVGKLNTLLGGWVPGGVLPQAGAVAGFTGVRLEGTLLQGAETAVDGFLDGITGAIPDVEIAVLAPAVEALRAAVSRIEAHVDSPAVVARFETVAQSLRDQAVKAGTAELIRRWLAQKSRFGGPAPVPEVADRLTAVRGRLERLSPLALLSSPADAAAKIGADLEAAGAQLSVLGPALARRLGEDRARLRALLPDPVTAEGFRRLLREGLEEQLGRPLRELIRLLAARLKEFDAILKIFQQMLGKLAAPLGAVQAVPETLTAVGAALVAAQERITGFNLSFIEDELQDVLEAVAAQLEALDPAALLPELEEIFQSTGQVLERLYPAAAVEALDAAYRETILVKIAALHPQKTIAEPLDAEYRSLLELQEGLDVGRVFQALEAKMKTLEAELDQGLDRSATAFNGLLAALPV